MKKIGERELRNLNIDIGNITFRKKKSKKTRFIILILKSVQLPESVQLSVLPESSLSQPEIPAEL
jgi:hypothetical protein